MIWSEPVIADALVRQTFNRKYVVVVPNCNWTGNECDLLAVTEKLRIIDVEIKISRADLKADAIKNKWWHQGFSYRPWAGETAPPRPPREWPPKVWKHYYAMPKEIWKPELMDSLPSKASGVILLSEMKHPHPPAVAVVWRRATPNRDAKPISHEAVIDIARLANLRMWAAIMERRKAAEDYQQVISQMKVAA